MKRIFGLIFLAALLSNCDFMKKEPLVIGHRGAMGHETENTLASIQKAMDLGVDMIEIDIFEIKSGEIAVFHDERVERLTNGGGRIEEYNVLDMKQLILDGGHKIPLLQDVLKLIDNRVPLNIELKGAATSDRVNFIIEYYVKNRGWEFDNFLISSFKWDELKEFRKFNDSIRIAVLTEENPLDAIAVAKELHAEAINPEYSTLTDANVQKLKEEGFKIYTYTVNELEAIAKMKEFQVDGIITNYPERVR